MAGDYSSKRGRSIPAYLLHKPTGQARCRINGRDHYLGLYGSSESRQKYSDLLQKHFAGVDLLKPAANAPATPIGATVAELCLAFMRHADQHYRQGGERTSEFDCYKLIIRPLVDLFGDTPTNELTPLACKALQRQLIDLKWVRKSINRAIARVRHIFKWGVEHGLVRLEVWQALGTLSPLLAGRSAARDNPPRSAVPEENIKAVRAEVSELVRDLIDLQRLTGARSGELLALTTAMIDRSGEVWSARLIAHKSAHCGQARTLHFGPKSRLIINRYLSPKQDNPLFSITSDAYRRAITRACKKLDLPRWSPHWLRHTAGAMIRDHFGIEHVQASLGHATADMSEHYAKLTSQKAVEVALAIG